MKAVITTTQQIVDNALPTWAVFYIDEAGCRKEEYFTCESESEARELFANKMPGVEIKSAAPQPDLSFLREYVKRTL
jgi:hypothetical protein